MQDPSHILNWRRRDARITLSGQPSEAELAELRDQGVSHIVNLGPHSNKGALDDEPGTVAALGLEYIYIPVDFDNPTEDDFSNFCKVLKDLEGHRIHVHCIYNARVSAFFYRHARAGLGGSVKDAFSLMDGIWRPGGVWARFIGHPEDADKPNRYLGEDY